MKQANNDRTNVLKGVSTLDEFCKNSRIVLLFLIVTVFGGSIYAGHSILDLVDPSFNPEVQTNSYSYKSVHQVQVLPDGKILAFGHFSSYNRVPVGRLVRLNADGSLDTTFNNQTVTSVDTATGGQMILQPDGKIILMCLNIVVGQSAPKNIVRINADGTHDTSFNYTLNSFPSDIALDSLGRIGLVGTFQFPQGLKHAVRLNSDGSLDNSFNFTTGGSPAQLAIAAQGSRLIVSLVLSPTQIYRLNEDGSADASFTPATTGGLVPRIIVQPDNKILFITAQNIRRLNENGGDDGSFQSPTFTSDDSPQINLAGDGKIVLALGPGNNRLFRRLLPNGTNDSSFNQYSHTAYRSFAVQPDDSIVIGDGYEPNITVDFNHFVRLKPDGLPDTKFNAGGIGFQNILPGSVRTIEPLPDGKVLIGGKFDAVNEILRSRIARLNADSTLDSTFQINTSGSGNTFTRFQQVYQIRAQSDGKVIVSGDFDYVLNGVTKQNFARLNTDGSIDTTFNLGVWIPDYSEIVLGGTNRFSLFGDGKLMVGTSSNALNELSVPLKLTEGGARDNSFNPTLNNQAPQLFAEDVAIQPDGKILIAGSYRPQGATNYTSFIARLNADGSTDLSFNYSEEPNRLRTVLALLPNGKILIAKSQVPFGGFKLQRLNADGSVDNSFNTLTIFNNFNQRPKINALLALPNGNIFVGGKFNVPINAQEGKNLLLLSEDGAFESTIYNLDEEVLCLALDGEGRVLVGGGFTVIDANGSVANRSYIARLTDSRRFDFDGDGRADIGVFSSLNRTWSILNSRTSQTASTQFGLNIDKIAPADYDGDGRADIAVYRPSEGNWYLLRSTEGFGVVRFGAGGDRPVPADYDGDGRADIAIWRPGVGDWWILQSSNNQSFTVHFGLLGDTPLPDTDFDGDGTADIAVWRPSDGNFYWMASGEGNQVHVVHWGMQDDMPVPADYNGDGKADLVVFRPSEGNWYQFLTAPNGDYSYSVTRFGLEGDEPVAADYDGDGKTDIALRRNGVWHLLLSGQGYTVVTFGNPGAQAIAALPWEVTIAATEDSLKN